MNTVLKRAIYSLKYVSPIGPIYIGSTEDEKLIWCSEKDPTDCFSYVHHRESPYLKQIAQLLEDYFAGESVDFSRIPIAETGTPFQQTVWSVLRTIPYGHTVSYKTLAHLAGVPKAVRAVGTAIGKNPILIIQPCHRIVRSDGSVGRYRLGTPVKRYLIDLEQGLI